MPASLTFFAPCRFAAFIGILTASGFLLCASRASAAAPATTEYRGFVIDERGVSSVANLEAVRAAIREQIDITCAVGLPEDILKFFQSVPFQIIPADSKATMSPGLYSGRTKKVEVTSRIVTTGHKPVLLHELLHAYHDQRIPGGYRNREILGFYAEGKGLRAFVPTSHMLQNEKEYFACAATTYLFGVTAQEPFNRAKLQDNQPKFVEYLKALFGPETGVYVGSLTRPSAAKKPDSP